MDDNRNGYFLNGIIVTHWGIADYDQKYLFIHTALWSVSALSGWLLDNPTTQHSSFFRPMGSLRGGLCPINRPHPPQMPALLSLCLFVPYNELNEPLIHFCSRFYYFLGGGSTSPSRIWGSTAFWIAVKPIDLPSGPTSEYLCPPA